MKRGSIMKKVKKVIMFIMLLSICLSIDIFASEKVKDPIAAGDVCGIIPEHECDFCIQNGLLLESVATTCPACQNGILRNACSGRRVMNGSDYYFYVQCYVSGHPSGCQTVQTRYYTDVACPNCEYQVSGSLSHIQAYYHSKDPTCYDDHYCTLPYPG